MLGSKGENGWLSEDYSWQVNLIGEKWLRRQPFLVYQLLVVLFRRGRVRESLCSSLDD